MDKYIYKSLILERKHQHDFLILLDGMKIDFYKIKNKKPSYLFKCLKNITISWKIKNINPLFPYFSMDEYYELNERHLHLLTKHRL